MKRQCLLERTKMCGVTQHLMLRTCAIPSIFFRYACNHLENTGWHTNSVLFCTHSRCRLWTSKNNNNNPTCFCLVLLVKMVIKIVVLTVWPLIRLFSLDQLSVTGPQYYKEHLIFWQQIMLFLSRKNTP